MREFLLLSILFSFITPTEARVHQTQNYAPSTVVAVSSEWPYAEKEPSSLENLSVYDEYQPSHTSSSKIIEEVRSNWIRLNINNLVNKAALPAADTIKSHTIDLEGFHQTSFRVNGSGYIHFDDGDWIYLVSNSSHTNEKVGDLTLAMDSKRRFYINAGHVCGGIIHFSTQQVFQTLDTELFFRHFVSDQDDAGWESIIDN